MPQRLIYAGSLYMLCALSIYLIAYITLEAQVAAADRGTGCDGAQRAGTGSMEHVPIGAKPSVAARAMQCESIGDPPGVHV